MRLNLRRKLYPLAVACFALTLVLGACNGGDDNVIDEPIIEEPAEGEVD